MKRRSFSLVLVAILLVSAITVSGGCGKPNSLSAIIVSPLTQVVAKGYTYQLLVTAIFSNRLVIPAWSQVTWSSSDSAVATVSSTGLVSGITAGTAEITATDMFHPNISHTATVYVTELKSITVTPADTTISAGTSTQFTATGLYTDQTPSAWSATWPPDITTKVLWTSSSTTVATIGLSGLATAGTSTGMTTITATELVTRITGTTTLTVN